MRYRKLGSSTITVSEICLGTMTFGTPVAEKEAIAIVRSAIDMGIDFFDTANIYEGYSRYVGSAGGVGETILGRALKGYRNRVVVATKVGMNVGSGKDDQGLSRIHILREVDRSLRKLECDAIDMYYMHKPDPNTPLAESVEAFSDLVKDGKIRAWGVSNFSAAELKGLLGVCDAGGYPRPIVIQPSYSVLNRQVEDELLPLCVKEGISAVPYRVLQGGVLTGKYHRGEPVPENSRQKEKPEWTTPLDAKMFDQLEALEKDASALGRGLMEHALKVLLSHDPVVSVLVGVKSIDQLEMIVRAVS
jgi:aryl-alcohol dehydrogenase-like predicted oxidoreductase